MSKPKELTAEDLKINHTYRAKRHRELFGQSNDRFILWIGRGMVQYDSDTVKQGRHYPKVSVEQFLRWAKEDITKEASHE